MERFGLCRYFLLLFYFWERKKKQHVNIPKGIANFGFIGETIISAQIDFLFYFSGEVIDNEFRL